MGRRLDVDGKTLVATGEEKSDPRTQWGIVQGAYPRYSQTIPYADKRTDIDRAAGRILELDF